MFTRINYRAKNKDHKINFRLNRWKRVVDEHPENSIYTEAKFVNRTYPVYRTVAKVTNDGREDLMAVIHHPYTGKKTAHYTWTPKQFTNMYNHLPLEIPCLEVGNNSYIDCYYHKHAFSGVFNPTAQLVVYHSQNIISSVLKKIHPNGKIDICGKYSISSNRLLIIDDHVTEWRVGIILHNKATLTHVITKQQFTIEYTSEGADYHFVYKQKKNKSRSYSKYIDMTADITPDIPIEPTFDINVNKTFKPENSMEYKILSMLSTFDKQLSDSHYSEIMKLIFRVCNAMYQIVYAPSNAYCLSIILTQLDLFMNAYADASEYPEIHDIKMTLISTFKQHLKDPPGNLNPIVETVEFEDQSGTSVFSHTKALLNGPLMQHFDTLACFFVTLGFVEPTHIKMGPFKNYYIECRAKTMTCPTFCEKILTAVEYLFTTGRDCFVSRSLQPLFGATNEVNALYNELNYLKANINNVVTGTYEMHAKQPEHHFIDKMHKTIAQAKLLQNNVNNSAATANLLMQILGSLSTIENSVLSYRKTVGSRKEPFAIKLFGGTAVGKSVLLPFLARGVLTANNMSALDDNIIYMQLADKYDSNAKGNATCYIADDLANDFHKNEVVSSSSIVIRMVNTATTMAVMPEAADKNTIPIEPFLFIVTTNKQNLNAKETSNCPESILRRFHLNATVRVAPQYCISTTNLMLDKSKLHLAPSLPNGLKDTWSIDVTILDDLRLLTHKIMNTPDWYIPYWSKPTLSNMTGREFIQFASHMARRHDREQTSRMSVINNDKLMTMCCACNMQNWLCQCAPVQSPPNSSNDSPIDPPVDMSGFISPKDVKAITSFAVWGYGMAQNVVNLSISSLVDKIIPKPMERNLVQQMMNNDVIMTFLGLHPTISGTFGWWNYVPSSIVTSQYFDQFYYYMERYTMIRRSLYCAQLMGCLTLTTVVSPKSWRTIEFGGYSLTITRTCCGIVGLISTALASRTVRQYNKKLIDDELLRRKISANAILLAATNTPTPLIDKVLKYGAYAAVGAGIVGLLRSLLSAFKDQSALNPTTLDEVQARSNTPNIWVSNTVDRVKGTMCAQDLLNKVNKNLISIVYKLPNGQSMAASALLLDADHILMNKHVWYYVSDSDGTYTSDITGDIIEYMDFTITRNNNIARGGQYTKRFFSSQVTEIDNTDAVVLKGCVNGATFNLVPFFVTQKELPAHAKTKSGVFTKRQLDGTQIDFMTTYNTHEVKYRRVNGMVTWPALEAHTSYRWIKGDCGAILISNELPPRILGMHTLGYETVFPLPSKGYSCLLTKEQLEAHMIQNHPVVPLDIIPASTCRVLSDHTSVVPDQHFINHVLVPDRMEIYGFHPKLPSLSSTVKTTMLAKTLENEGHGPNDWKGPLMRRYRSWEPFQVFFEKVMDPMRDIEYLLLEKAKHDYIMQITTQILKFPEILKDLYPLSNHEILNGRHGVKYMERMNMKSSCCFPFSGKKSNKLVIQTLNASQQQIYVLRPEKEFIWDEIKLYEEQLLSGNECYFPFVSQAKDEIVSKLKKGVNNTKVRVFQSSCLPLSFLMRKYFLPVLRLLPTFPLHSECLVGLNCYSPEFSEVFEHIIEFGTDRLFAGDYSSWDQRVSSQLSEAAFDVIMNITQICNINNLYTEDDLRIMWSLKYAITHAFVICYGVITRLHACNPSGQTMTTFMNSIMNSLLARCAFFDANPHLPGSFSCYMRIITYGDDIVESVRNDINFNFTHMQQFLLRHNMVFTTDKKDSGNGTQFIPLQEITFLKRNFVYHPSIGSTLGALDIKSMYKGLYNYMPKDEAEINVMISSLDVFAQELFAHGQEIYDLILPHICYVAEKHNICLPGLTKSYKTRAREWMAQYNPQIDYADYCLYEEQRARNHVIIQTSPQDVLQRFAWVREAQEFRPGNTLKYIKEWFFKTTEPDNRIVSELTDESVGDNPEDQSGIVVNIDQLADSPAINTELISFPSTAPEDVTIAKYLSRPVLLKDYTVAVNTEFDASFRTLQEFLAIPSINRKVANYRYIAGNMHIIATINGTIAHWGRYIISHDPWPTGSINTATNANRFFDTELYQDYQLQHIMVDPGSGIAGTMKFPILDPRDNKFDMMNADDVGCYPSRLRIKTMSQLKAANGGSTSLSLRIYAYMTEVELSGAILDQSVELPTGPISAVATMGQHITDVIGDAFSIQEATKPVSIALGKVSKVASVLGYSKPTDIKSRHQIIPISSAGFAHCNDDLLTNKLSYDVKQSISVDPASHGFSHEDQMSLAYIAKKDHFCDRVAWLPSNPTGTYLYRMAIAPFHETLSEVSRVSPAAWIAQAFRSFRGTCYIRVEIVASALHRGRLRVSYEPFTNLTAATPPALDQYTNELYSQVVDLTESRAYEFCIGWQQHEPWKSSASWNQRNTGRAFTSTSGLALPDNNQCNGYLAITVENDLVLGGELATSLDAAEILIYSRWGDDFCVADPSDRISAIRILDPVDQSADLGMTPSSMRVEHKKLCLNNSPEVLDEDNSIHMATYGERIYSIRQVVKRFTTSHIQSFPRASTSATTFREPDFPPFRGKSTFKFPVQFITDLGPIAQNATTLLHWCSAPYLAYSGGIRHKIITPFSRPAMISVQRVNGPSTFQVTTQAIGVVEAQAHVLLPSGVSGMAFTNLGINQCLDVEFPFQSTQRWRFVRPDKTSDATSGSLVYDGSWHSVVFTGVTDSNTTAMYFVSVAGADDFSLFQFKYVPVFTYLAPSEVPGPPPG